MRGRIIILINPLNQFSSNLFSPYLLINSVIILILGILYINLFSRLELRNSILTNVIFVFILLNNLIGLIPYSYTTTSQFSMTLSLSLIIILTVSLKRILEKDLLSFFKAFIPKGEDIPKLLGFLIAIIEFISYLMRILSLAIRLSANLISGHILLYIISYFTKDLSLLGISLGFPLFLLEIAISFIQAYVFILLTITYFKESH